MNTALRVLVLAALAGGLWAGPAALAQSDKANVGQIGTIDRREAEEVQQVGATDRRDAEEVQQITPSTGGKVLIDPAAGQASRSAAVQQSGGRDLCDPSVPDSVRKAAGVDCSRQISIERRATTGLADDPLLRPRREDLDQGFDALGLGKDVPATVILQQ